MTPILGILASGISGNLVTNSYESIATTTVGSPVSTVTFSSIPSTYRHLQLRATVRATGSFTSVDGLIRFNSDTAANYAYHALLGDGATATADLSNSITAGRFARNSLPGNNILASVYGSYVIDILDYANTNTNKTVRTLSAFDANGSGTIELVSSLWQSTTAISTISLTTDGGNFAANTQFALYGIKG